MEPDGRIIVVGTPWYEDDLYHTFTDSEQLICRVYPVHTEAGTFLWPGLRDAAWLEHRRLLMADDTAFQMQYFCRVISPIGDLFHRDWFPIIEELPTRDDGTLAITGAMWIWDTAATHGGGDYSVGILGGRGDDGKVYIMDVCRGQWDSTELINHVRSAFLNSRRQYGALVSGMLLEDIPAGGNKHLKAALILRDPTLKSCIAMQPTDRKSKVERAKRILWFCHENRGVVLLRGPWNTALLDELVSFTEDDRHAADDQVDAFAYVVFKASGLSAVIAKPTKTTQTTHLRVVPA